MAVGRQVIHTKAKLSQAQANALEKVRTAYYDYEIIDNFCSDYREDVLPEEILDMQLETLVCALYIGFEIEKTPQEKVLEYFKQHEKDNDTYSMEVIQEVLRMSNIKIKGINE